MPLSLQRYICPQVNWSLIQLLNARSKKDRESSIGIAIENGDCLPENLFIEILSWLSVKDLLRYKSICKSWRVIISSPDFISKHLQNYYRNNYDWRGCLLAQYYLSHAELQLFTILVDDTPTALADGTLDFMPMYGSYICGPCDGLYYVNDYELRAIWNPAMNEIKLLPGITVMPNPPPDTTLAQDRAYGFGFDPISKDYKVVVIKGYKTTREESIDYPQSVLVYSLRNDSWRYCGDLCRHYQLDKITCYNFVNGCCYWLESSHVCRGVKQGTDAIICFNMAIDYFEEIRLPNYKQPASKCLGIYDDSIAFISLPEIGKQLEIWTMKEGIWIMKFRMGPLLDVRNPVGHWKDNIIVLESKVGNLVLLYPETQDAIRYLSFQCSRFCEGIFAYMESLVSIKGSVVSCGFSPPINYCNIECVNVHAIETSDSDSESESEYGIHGLFVSETSESDI